MTLIEIIVLILVSLLPLLIVLLPFIFAWIRGSKNVEKAHRKYERALKISFDRLFHIHVDYSVSDKSIVEGIITGENSMSIKGKLWLVDRRYYFYYIAKMFRPLNDAITLEIKTRFIPGCSLVVVSKSKPKLIDQALAYSEEFEVLKISSLDAHYLILTDNIYNAKALFDRYFASELLNLKNNISYLLIDYTAPNFICFFETNEKEYSKMIPRILTLVKVLIDKSGKLAPQKTKLEIAKRLKNALRKTRR